MRFTWRTRKHFSVRTPENEQLAMTVRCPHCHSEPGVGCRISTRNKLGEPGKFIHDRRIRAALRERREEASGDQLELL